MNGQPDVGTDSSPYSRYLKKVSAYLAEVRPPIPGVSSWDSITVSPLAAGEYNINFLLSGACAPSVFRINIGTQINRQDQILYEFRTLELLRQSGVTPIPYHVDDTRIFFDKGILIMEYLPGEPLDYARDVTGAAKVFGTIHRIRPAPAKLHLIREEQPLDLIYRECSGLLDVYFNSPLARPQEKKSLRNILAWAEENSKKERYYLDDPWFCIVNTEVNSGNFIVNREKKTTHLIDWEMGRWGDPSSDLCHFISPLTTLWKTDFRFSRDDADLFLKTYKQQVDDSRLAQSLEERMRLKMPFVLMRGISWSAMAWVAYQGEYGGIRNRDTWNTLNRYLDKDFITSLFSPYLDHSL